jgi:hypothetical protein
MSGKHEAGNMPVYSPKHASGQARVQPFAGDNKRNLQPQQFGKHASGKVNTGGLFSKGTHKGGKFGMDM